ncbi:substrate-binding periplasmic protein [Pseudomaricurvus alkylphenolicus]|uniref:substrate-binding periplasmic protein n=1 Tax=Pseudomaricurvus alkylphenolicus TaxID=1306991 RepID=UPI00142354C2|nr:transporter substrate-binding domain-containing protein [Pseudomaricurvus alkylphenolicus]
MIRRCCLLAAIAYVLWMISGGVHAASLTQFRACTADVINPPYIDRLTVKKPGILFEIVSDAAVSVGLEVRFHRLPWRRCLHEVQQGRIDAVFTLTRTPERETQFAFPATEGPFLIRSDYTVFVQNRGIFDQEERRRVLAPGGRGWNFTAYRSLKKTGLSAPFGFITFDQLKTQGAAAIPREIRSGLRLVAKGRLDGYVTETFAGRYVARQLGIDTQLSEASILRTDQEHIAFNRVFYQKHREDIERYWGQLEVHRDRVIAAFLQQKSTSHLPTTVTGER